MTNYQKLTFYSASISRKDTCYLIAGTQIDNYSYWKKAHSWPTSQTVNHITTSQLSNLHWKYCPDTIAPCQLRSKEQDLRDHVAYFISNQNIKKGLDLSIHVIDGIYDIKGKLTLYILVANYTNKHVTFNKGQCTGHVEPSINNM